VIASEALLLAIKCWTLGYNTILGSGSMKMASVIDSLLKDLITSADVLLVCGIGRAFLSSSRLF
jgi:hypothetical protein